MFSNLKIEINNFYNKISYQYLTLTCHFSKKHTVIFIMNVKQSS